MDREANKGETVAARALSMIDITSAAYSTCSLARSKRVVGWVLEIVVKEFMRRPIFGKLDFFKRDARIRADVARVNFYDANIVPTIFFTEWNAKVVIHSEFFWC